jgi:hypothetical protein
MRVSEYILLSFLAGLRAMVCWLMCARKRLSAIARPLPARVLITLPSFYAQSPFYMFRFV